MNSRPAGLHNETLSSVGGGDSDQPRYKKTFFLLVGYLQVVQKSRATAFTSGQLYWGKLFYDTVDSGSSLLL